MHFLLHEFHALSVLVAVVAIVFISEINVNQK